MDLGLATSLPHQVKASCNARSADVKTEVQYVEMHINMRLVHVLGHHVGLISRSGHLAQWEQPSSLLLLYP